MTSLIITNAKIETSTNVNMLSNDNSLHRYETNIEKLIYDINNEHSQNGTN